MNNPVGDVHSRHFWFIFFVWQKNDYKMKLKMKSKMVTVNAPKCKY